MKDKTAVRIVVDPSKSGELRGRPLLDQVIDPEISRFAEWFQKPENGNSRMTKMERELFRSYLYQKITGAL
jgi:hypothetical protein